MFLILEVKASTYTKDMCFCLCGSLISVNNITHPQVIVSTVSPYYMNENLRLKQNASETDHCIFTIDLIAKELQNCGSYFTLNDTSGKFLRRRVHKQQVWSQYARLIIGPSEYGKH